jgi:hypothetical protein
MKQCRICLQEKDYTGFYPRASSADGYRHDCKECCIARSKARYRKDLEASRAWHREHHHQKIEANPNWYAEHYAANQDKFRRQNAAYYHTRYRDRRLIAAKKWVAENRGKSNAIKKAYKVAKARACPAWLTEDEHWMMYEAYELAHLRSELLGYVWHVDHIIPLQGRTVSGLHVPWNLQVIPGVDNMSKSNKFQG